VLTKKDWKNIKIDSVSLPYALHCWQTETRFTKINGGKSRSVGGGGSRVSSNNSHHDRAVTRIRNKHRRTAAENTLKRRQKTRRNNNDDDSYNNGNISGQQRSRGNNDDNNILFSAIPLSPTPCVYAFNRKTREKHIDIETLMEKFDIST
jgi:hypothetical protein